MESVLAWASRLGDRTAYLIVENSIAEHTDFRYWRESEQALLFQQKYSPAVMRMDYRLPVLENATRNHGVTLGAVAGQIDRRAGVAEGIAGDARPELPATHVRRIRQGAGVAFAMSEQDELFEPDLIDRIANALPVEVRAEYYRELRHCRSLPENDEMLRILRAMQFSVLIMVEVPARMATERERFEQTVADTTKLLQEVRQFTEEHQAQIDQRLGSSPGGHRGRH